MNNIFENAYLGKAYKTRDGRKAIYRTHHRNHYLFTENTQFACNDEGSIVSIFMPIPELDIVSEWHEEINDEKHDILPENYVPGTKEYMDVY